MLKTFELSNPASCLNKASFNEPLFVLRAKDPNAAQTIRLWAAMSVNTHEPSKIDEALKLAHDMEDWRTQNIPGRVTPV